MGLLTTIKQFLPPSSRSFHEMYRKSIETSWIIEGIDERLDRMEQVNNSRFVRLERLFAESNRQLDAHDTHMKLLAWSLYRQEGEALDDAKKRFFRQLSPATGMSRLIQLGCAQLLHEFDEICRENDLPYWATWGTLLGTIRHQGFIPWDDDADVGMMREDIRTLIDIVSSSERHVVTVIYDYRAACRQVRFRYRDEAIPCFIDIFIHDYLDNSDGISFERQHFDLRRELHEQVRQVATAHWTYDHPLIPNNDPNSEPIGKLFDTFVEQQTVRNGANSDASAATSIVWSVDNIDEGFPGHWHLLSIDDYFPVTHMPFEGGEIAVPHRYEAILFEMFGDYLSLPSDINGHINQHYKPEDLDSMETAEAIEALLAQRND